jgi:uncharacterized phage protein (TIGR02218 family)
MITHPTLSAWLPTARAIAPVQLLQVTRAIDGAVWRYCSSTQDLVDGATVYRGSAHPSGLVWQRSAITSKAGLELGEATVTIYARDTDYLGSLPIAQAIRAGAWDGATLLLSTAYLDEADALRGILPRYQGQRGTVKMVNGVVTVQLKPPSITFNRSVPPVYTAGCLNTLFDAACGVSRAAYTLAGTAQAGSTATACQTGRGEAANYFAGGVLTFTSGPLTGLSRTVRSHAAGGLCTPFDPWPTAPVAGNAYTLTPGCNRSLGAGGCDKFANRLRYRGYPFIPLPEAAI